MFAAADELAFLLEVMPASGRRGGVQIAQVVGPRALTCLMGRTRAARARAASARPASAGIRHRPTEVFPQSSEKSFSGFGRPPAAHPIRKWILPPWEVLRQSPDESTWASWHASSHASISGRFSHSLRPGGCSASSAEARPSPSPSPADTLSTLFDHEGDMSETSQPESHSPDHPAPTAAPPDTPPPDVPEPAPRPDPSSSPQPPPGTPPKPRDSCRAELPPASRRERDGPPVRDRCGRCAANDGQGRHNSFPGGGIR